MKKAIISVTNDLITDQRVNKVAVFLSNLGFSVTLVGRKLNDSLPIDKRTYETYRMRLLFNKGALFYAEYNIRLFFYLLFKKHKLLVSNDLDTLLANFLCKVVKKSDLVYDSHEFYTGTPELVNRHFTRKIWEKIEAIIFPKLKDIITVNDSIALLYEKKYNKKLFVVRNIPNYCEFEQNISKKDLAIDENCKIIILQGAGINVQRGAEEAVQAMEFVEGAVLLIVGGGDVINNLKQIVNAANLKNKVIFIPKQPYGKLCQYTRLANIGLSLDKDTNINYRFSLPNKLFDYIHANIPILASNLPEIAKIINTYNIGEIIDNHDITHIAEKINSMLNDKQKIDIWKKNLKIAAKELTWQNEIKILEKIYLKYV